MKPFGKSMLVVVCLLSVAMMLGAAWTSRRLTENTGDSEYPDVAASGLNFYVVWEDNTKGNDEIFFRKSINGGATWQTAKRLTNNVGGSSCPRIAVWGSNVFVVWQDDTSGNPEIYLRKSTDGGATWQTEMGLTNNTGNSKWPDIAVSGSNVYVVWEDDTPGNYEIYFRKSINGGATWQTARRLTNNTGESHAPRISVLSSNVYVVWCDTTPGNYEVYFRKSTDGGATWQPAKRLSNNTGGSYNPTIAVSALNVYIVWYDYTPGIAQIYFKKSTDGGGVWQTSKKLTNNAGSSGWPTIAVRESNVFVAYYDYTPGNPEIYLRKSTDAGATWPTAVRLTNNTGSSCNPAIAVNALTVYTVWQDYTPGNYDIYLKYDSY